MTTQCPLFIPVKKRNAIKESADQIRCLIYPLEAVKPDTRHLKRILSYQKGIYKALKDKDLRAAKAAMEERLIMAHEGLSEYFQNKK